MNLVSTKSVEFSFNDEMFCQIDGISMGSPLGPILTNIFVGFNKQLFLQRVPNPSCYFRYVDDTFVMSRSEKDSCELFDKLNLLHPSLKFTMEKENNDSLPFLDVLVQRCETAFTTGV